MCSAALVPVRKIAPYIPVFDKSGRNDGTWTRADFERDSDNDQYICPEGFEPKQFRRNHSDPNRANALVRQDRKWTPKTA